MKDLVDEWVIGEEYEFSDEGCEQWKRLKLLHVLPERFGGRFLVELDDYTASWHCYDRIRHIQNREILDQIEVLKKELNNLKSKIK